MKTAITAAVTATGIALAAAGCGGSSSPASPAHTVKPSPAVGAIAAPSWCTPALASAINGNDAATLLPYVHGSRYIRDIYQSWNFTLAENALAGAQWSIQQLENNAPVTTTGLQNVPGDVRQLNRICGSS
ncbi:MAG TPA: hypothetical protein VMV92_39200 [Streptosporangiaceae bacterium]|nr:hypothetical protein [Streptosporangiaceae bacterium]